MNKAYLFFPLFFHSQLYNATTKGTDFKSMLEIVNPVTDSILRSDFTHKTIYMSINLLYFPVEYTIWVSIIFVITKEYSKAFTVSFSVSTPYGKKKNKINKFLEFKKENFVTTFFSIKPMKWSCFPWTPQVLY